MGLEEVVIWAGRGLLYADKPRCRKAAPSKIGISIHLSFKYSKSIWNFLF